MKLLDGGLVDNYGLAGFTIARLASNALWTVGAEEAVKLRRFLFLVVDRPRAVRGLVANRRRSERASISSWRHPTPRPTPARSAAIRLSTAR
jgi:hypothetical protein